MLFSKTRYFFSHSFPLTKQLHAQPKAFISFNTLTSQMEVRKNAAKKLKSLNKKAYRQTLPFHLMIADVVKEHKKKTIFFILLAGLAVYYEYYLKIYRYFRTMEPMKLKMRRWFLGEERILAESIKETFIEEEGFKLKPETQVVLSDIFVKADKEFAYGVTRKFLKKVFTKIGYIENKKDKEQFYNEGPYRRRLNQRVSGVSLKQFLVTFEKALKKMQKANPGLTEEDLVRRILGAWDEAKEKGHRWEERLMDIRNELRKAGTVFEDDKNRIIMKKLRENPETPIEELDRELARNGFYGLGLKDKLLALEYQLMYSRVRLAYYKSRLAKEVIPAKSMKIEGKIKQFEEKVQNQSAELEKHKARFTDVFKRKIAEGEEGENKSE